MARISRKSILPLIVAALLLATLPRVVHQFLQTGEFYPLSPQFFHDVLARLSGPGRMRFILQPTVAILLGARDGVRDARAGVIPYLQALFSRGSDRLGLLRSAKESIQNLAMIAILLDIISQFLIFREIHPGAALLVGPVLIAIPYSLSRGLSNRIAQRRMATQS